MPDPRPLSELIIAAPEPFDVAAAEQARASLAPAFGDLSQKEQDLLSGAAGCSPYLRRMMLRDRDGVLSILASPVETSLEKAAALTREAGKAEDEKEQLRLLRQAKRQAAMTIALADIAGAADVMEAASALSHFADACVSGAIEAALKRSPLESATGIAILAMGKHGAFELNYSSDIDLVVLFDRERMGVADPASAQDLAVRLTREFVRLLHSQTPDGYVFRTDLRLRPDPGVSHVAVPVSAAETYYEAYGQNWERMAYIKARPCAGDMELGEKFLSALRPFVWRRHLDFAAIEDVHAVKRQIHTVKGGAAVEFEGHDIKLGRGGIREIEFYAQTQQLILGGKNPELRLRATLDVLAALEKHGHITDLACKELSAAYRYLRHVEHRLQMINDEQTHRIPLMENDIERVRIFAGEKSADEFRTLMVATLKIVQRHYAELFETDEDRESVIGALVFTGVEDHPETLETLSRLGFKRGPDISAAIRRWHTGAMRATRTERARVLLTKLVPYLLEALSNAGNPDDAFFAFERFLSRLPAGVQVFSLLLNNLSIFDSLIRIMTISPYLGRELSNRINFVERLLDNDWSAPPPEPESYRNACAGAAARAEGYEQALNAVRRWAGEQRFLIAAQLAVGLLPPDEAATHFSAIAEACIHTLAPVAQKEIERLHGRIDGDMAIVALGRLGASEMTAVSDIDIMFVYDAPEGATSDGEKPIGPVDYYTRLVRRIVTALSAATEEGALYDVDMQLRPSGGAGPTAVSLSAFRHYYEEDAWTWEAMALVRARVISKGTLADSVAKEIETILSRKRDAKKVAEDVIDMRRRLLEAKPAESVWDVKHASGGMTDISFICQYLALISAHRLGPPPRKTEEALSWFADKDELPQKTAAALTSAWRLYEALLQTGRAATAGVFSPDSAGMTLCDRMASICGTETVEAAEAFLIDCQSATAKTFRTVIDNGG